MSWYNFNRMGVDVFISWSPLHPKKPWTLWNMTIDQDIQYKIILTKSWRYWCVTFLWMSFTFETSSSLWAQNRKIERFPFLPPLCCSSCPDLLNCDQIAGSLLLTAVTRKFLTSTSLGLQSLGILIFWNTGRPRSYISQEWVSMWECLK